MSRGREPRSNQTSKTLAHGTRLGASRVPDNILAGSREERALRKLRRRVARWQWFHRIR